MKNIKVECLNKSHTNPEEFISNIVSLTFSKKLNTASDIKNTLLDAPTKIETLKNVIEMNHTGMLEHVTVTYLIQGASRSLLSQITRHRLFSFVSASQHYMDYSDFADFVVPVELEQQGQDVVNTYIETNKKSVEEYKKLISTGIDPSIARQVLPNSMRNNLIVTGNLREWLNFMNLRLCNRNTSEIQYIAMLIKDDLLNYIPTIAKYMVPDCIKCGHCTQKHLYCGKPFTDIDCHTKYKILERRDTDEN